MRPEYKSALLSIHRETFNFLKHANKDYDEELYVGEIARSNFLQLGVCVANYHSMFGVWTEHMQLFFKLFTILAPGAHGNEPIDSENREHDHRPVFHRRSLVGRICRNHWQPTQG
jgi:hypothetical protein